MSLPSDILRFFQVESAEIPTLPLKTISDFFEEMDKSYSQQDALQVINAFKISGDLFSFGNFPTSSRSPLKEMLMGLSFNEEKAMHGLYDFKIHGFSAIAPHFRKSVRPVVVELNDGSYDIGTCFLIGKSKYILTAKHVIENTNTIQISNENGELVEACEVIISKEKNIDIAIIIVENDPFKDLPVLVSEDGKILEEVMTIGYPPIPGFDAVQIYEASTINNSFKFSRGQIVANDTAYRGFHYKWTENSGLLINAYRQAAAKLVARSLVT